jgi:2-iminobutanoate/2-iminopropanoate deaminase
MTSSAAPRLRRIAAAPGVAPSVGPFSGAVVTNGFVFTSGQIPGTGDDADLDFGTQVQLELENLERILLAAGSDRQHVVKVTTYLTDVDQLATYNTIYAQFFAGHLPARTTVCVAALWGVALELECVAVLADSEAGRPSATGGGT